jgi:hypothetical protein
MDLIAYLFATIWNAKWFILLALVVWIINACRSPVKRSVVHDNADYELEQQRKLRATIETTADAYGINVRKERQ